MEPLFSLTLLENIEKKISEFHIPNLLDKTIIVENLIAELESGKLESLKEEEIKSRFVNEIFGDILDYNYGNSEHWMLREEVKSSVDGTKPDAALGYFRKDKNENDIRAVIEIKNARTDLDKAQKRTNSQSPVDQAFQYSVKTNGTCRWVIVSNLKEIRFYASNDISKFQRYNLVDLKNRTKLKEFLFLFHKSRFILRDKTSKTDSLLKLSKRKQDITFKGNNIIDKIYNSLQRLGELKFVEPEYISNLYPFNILGEYVWHYHKGILFTINHEIYKLLKHLTVDSGTINLSEQYLEELESQKVFNPIEKLEWIFNFLNHSAIHTLTAIKDHAEVEAKQKKARVIGFSKYHIFHFDETEGVSLDITMPVQKCECESCQMRSLDIKSILKKLKASAGYPENFTPGYAYRCYMMSDYKAAVLTNDFLTKGKHGQHKSIQYFLAQFNLRNLFTSIRGDYFLADRESILNSISAINLDTIIHDELEFMIDSDVRNYLVRIKEDQLQHNVKKAVDELVLKADKLKKHYEKGGTQIGGLNIAEQLIEKYQLLYLHVNANFIVADKFTSYQEIIETVFKGILMNYRTPVVGIKTIPFFITIEALLHIPSDKFNELLTPRTSIKFGSVKKLFQRFNLFFNSFYDEYTFGPTPNSLIQEFTSSYSFKRRLGSLSGNIFILLANAQINKEDLIILETSMVKFLYSEDILYHYHLDYLCSLLKAHGNLFTAKVLVEMLQISINRHEAGNNKYEQLIAAISKAIFQHQDKAKINDKGTVLKAIANSNTPGGWINYKPYLYLPLIVEERLKDYVVRAFDEYLDDEFNSDFYESLLRNKIYDYEYKSYFGQYINDIRKYAYSLQFKDEKPDYTNANFTFFNFGLLIHNLQIKLTSEQISLFRGLPDFERWLLDPETFDYRKFKYYWIRAFTVTTGIFKKINKIPEIKLAVENSLKLKFDQELSDIYVRYFL